MCSTQVRKKYKLTENEETYPFHLLFFEKGKKLSTPHSHSLAVEY